ncbi:hypothetical protein COU20_01150, partial [Candidatus Kaiserbacteria bacterium CG10_big_fil_rev_8_21_14_0_10_59_10]
MFRLTRTAHLILALLVSVFFFAHIFAPLAAHAYSVVWSSHAGDWRTDVPWPIDDLGARATLENIHVSVEYGIRMTDAATGRVLKKGETVPLGTRVNLSFIAHQKPHINWFVSVGSWDSPYGHWMSPWWDRPPQNMEKIAELYSHDGVELYATYAVEPPGKSIGGTGSLPCSSSGANRICTLNQPGSYTFVFNFDRTPGGMWARSTFRTWDDGNPSSKEIPVPAQKISFPLTVAVAPAEGDGQGAPEQPVVSASGAAPEGSASASVSGSGVCIVGQPYTIQMTATDPEGDRIRFGIDWDANGTIDQFAPSTGFVPSGSTQTAQRTFSTSGTKTIQVLTMDEHGHTSGWVSHTFVCGETGEAAPFQFSDDTSGTSGNQSPSLTLRAIPSLVRIGETTNLHWSAANVASCAVRGTNGDS